MHAHEILEKLGLKPAEARTYLFCWRTGDATASDLARQLGMPRSSVQIILERLHHEGLMGYYSKRRYVYWSAESPKKILAALQEKETLLASALPMFMALRETEEGHTPGVRLFKGMSEIEHIYNDLLRAQQHLFVIAPWEVWAGEIGIDFLKKADDAARNTFIEIRFLTTRSPQSAAYQAGFTGTTRYMRFLPERINISDVTMLCSDKAAIISLHAKQPLGILIDDEAISNTKRLFFDELWRISTDV